MADLVKIPSGRREVNAYYGNPVAADGSLDEDWARRNLIQLKLPFVLRYIDEDGTHFLSHLKVHRNAAGSFYGALMDIWVFARIRVKDRDGYDRTTEYYDDETYKYLRSRNLDVTGGTYNFRKIIGRRAPSTHSYGIAIDMDPEHNPLGSTKTTFPAWYIAIWNKHGFFWGGDFKGRKDPMHFQRAKNV